MVNQCTTAIVMGSVMGAGVGGSAGTIIGAASGFFGGHRRMGLVRHTFK
jgi:hypothetical protein